MATSEQIEGIKLIGEWCKGGYMLFVPTRNKLGDAN